MKRFVFLLPLLLLFQGVPSSEAQETPKTHLEFLRGLRDKGYFDLAEAQLEKLKALADPEMKALLPLESARLQLAQAKEKPAEQRGPYFTQAGKDLVAYIKANAGKPEAVQAQLELARLFSFQAEALLSKALQEPSLAAAHVQARPAEKQFLLAGAELEQAAKALTALAEVFKSDDPKEEKRVRQQMSQDYWQARLERAANYVNLARTYLDIGKTVHLKGRTEKLVEARKAFEAIYLDTKEPAVQAVARAWIGKCALETDAPDVAAKHLDAVINDTAKTAQAGQRLARFFYIQWVPTNPKIKGSEKEKIALMEKLSLAWLKEYPGNLKTPEGQGVQFELAEAYSREANLLWQADIQKAIAKEKDKEKAKEMARGIAPPKGALELFDKAQRLYDAVAAGDSDYAEKANQQSTSIAFRKMGETTSIDSLRDFPSCFLRAQFELMRMRHAMETGKEKERKTHLRQAVRSLRRGLILADARTPPSKIDEARFLLTTAYLVQEDFERAAVMGEFLAHLRPPTKRSPAGAGYALEAYAGMLQRENENNEENRRRLQTLADFVLSDENQKMWKDDAVTPVARFQVAMALMKDQDEDGRKPYPQVIEHLEKITPEFPGYAYIQGQLVFIAQEARAQKSLSPERQAFYVKVARNALAHLKDLPANPDPATAAMFFSAKLQNAQFLYEDAAEQLRLKQLVPAVKVYQEMGTFLDGLKGQIEKQPAELVPEETKDRLLYELGVLRKFATLGQAEIEYRQREYKKVLTPAMTGATLDAVRKMKAGEDGKIRLKDFQVTSELLVLALRAQVQDGQVKEAKETFRFLEILSGEEGDIEAGLNNVLRKIVEDLQTQVRELKASGDAKRLEETVKNFSDFLSDRADSFSKAKKVNNEELGFLASAYASLDLHDKAADLFRKIPAPEALSKPAKAAFAPEEEADLYRYWILQIEFAKTRRLGGAEMKEADKKEAAIKEANGIVERLLKHPHARMNLMAKEERLYIYEEAGLYGTAIGGWTDLMKEPFLKDNLAGAAKLRILFDRRPKDVYFNAFYHYGYSVYRYAQSEAGKKAGATAKYTDFAAKHFLRLKNAASPEGWQIVEPLFNDLRARETAFREAFEAAENAEKK